MQLRETKVMRSLIARACSQLQTRRTSPQPAAVPRATRKRPTDHILACKICLPHMASMCPVSHLVKTASSSEHETPPGGPSALTPPRPAQTSTPHSAATPPPGPSGCQHQPLACPTSSPPIVKTAKASLPHAPRACTPPHTYAPRTSPP